MDLPEDFDQSDTRSAGAVITEDRPCLSCGYNLRGLSAAGHCPECGAEVERSLRPRLLRYAAPAHARILHRGAFVVEATIVAAVATLVLEAFSGLLAAGLSWDRTVVKFFVSLLSLLIGLSGALGWWWLSSPDPADTLADSDSRSRRALRCALVAYGAAATAAFVASLAGVGRAGSAPLADGLGLVATVTMVVEHLVALSFVRTLADRLPSRRLNTAAQSLASFGIAITIPAGLLLALAVGNLLGWNLGILNSLWCLGLPLAICLLVWYLMYWSMIDRLRVELLASRHVAEQPFNPRRANAKDPQPQP